MTFAQGHKWVTYAIAGLGLYALTLGGTVTPVAKAIAGLAFAASWFVEAPLVRRPAWGRAWTALVVAFFLVQVSRGIGRANLLALGIEYVAFLQVSRLMNRRTGKDHDQIAILAFLHLIVATVLTTSIAYGLVFVGFLVVTPWMLTLTHLRRDVEETPGRGPDAVEAALGSRDVVGSRFFATTLGLTVPIFFVTVALFLLFPRVGLGFASVRGFGGQPTTGFGKNVELGGFGTIREDPTVVLRVSGPVEALGPPGTAVLRMRGTAFDTYDGRTWVRTQTGSTVLPSDYGAYPLVRYPDRAHDFEYKVVLDRIDEPVIFLPDGAVSLTIPPRVKVGRNVMRRVRASAGFDFRYEDADEQGLAYSVFVSKDRREWRRGGLASADRPRFLALPAGVERVAALAQKVTAGATTDRERAERILRHLRDSGSYRYSLSLPNTEGRNPLDVFLFEAKRGHCEYFSTAMAVMLRAVGVPTREVTGFMGGAYNPYGEYYALRRADAHSWLEAWIGDRWITLDPTPPARNAMGPERSLFSPIRDFLDAVRTRWARQVVGYDIRAQTDALRRSFRWGARMKRWFKDRFRGGDEATSPSAGTPDRAPGKGPLFVFLAVLVIVPLGAWLAWRRLRAREALRAVPPAAREAVLAYRALERVLDDRGWARPSHVTPGEHAAWLAAEGFPEASAVDALTARYLRTRFGRTPWSASDAAACTELLARVRRSPPAPRPRTGA